LAESALPKLEERMLQKSEVRDPSKLEERMLQKSEVRDLSKLEERTLQSEVLDLSKF
jgi:hypothetical protein